MDQPTEDAQRISARVFWILFLLIALLGGAMRVADSAAWRSTGFDEILYRRYVNMMDGGEQVAPVFQRGDRGAQPYKMVIEGRGAGAMPEMVRFFLETQKSATTECELPPTRFLYLYTSWLWKRAQFGGTKALTMREINIPGEGDSYAKDADHVDPALASLHRVACLFTMLAMLGGGLAAWRMAGHWAGLGALALMAFDPVQIHFSQHALIDGVFLLWAVLCVWTTWECLRNPASWGWLAAHTVCLALMVLTKENAFFVYCALGAVVLVNRWLHFGKVTPRFLLLSIAGPLLALIALVVMAGGPTAFVEVYRTLVAKAQNLAYAQKTGDGPWHRYLLDVMTVSPVVLCLALGALFAVAPRRKDIAFLAVFVAASYLLMCNVKYGINLRYASIWALPFRAAAFAMLWQMCARFGQRQGLVVCVLVAGLCAYELRQYTILAMNPERPLYELVPNDLLRLLDILKP